VPNWCCQVLERFVLERFALEFSCLRVFAFVLERFALKRYLAGPIYPNFGGKVGGQSFAKIVTASSL
jgi:hypothetical protein